MNNPLVQPDPGLYIWTIATFLVLAGQEGVTEAELEVARSWRAGQLSVEKQTPGAIAPLVSATPIALFLREHEDAWRMLRAPAAGEPTLSDPARRVLSALHARGASFFRVIAEGRRALAHDGDEAELARACRNERVAAGLARATAESLSWRHSMGWSASTSNEPHCTG